MANCKFLLNYLISLSLVFCINLISCTIEDNRKVYIVYMGSSSNEKKSVLSYHVSLLEDVMGESYAYSSLVRSYQRSFNGFAAKLNKDEVEKLAKRREVVSVFPSKKFQLHTTRSWDFLGLANATNAEPAHGSDIIIGVIDTGILVESESFNDDGYAPPPKKWKGACDGGADFKCNNKIIGARRYKFDSARDNTGHGSHTASTAAGNKVSNTSFYGIANGTARGGLPSGRIAVYKVCDEECSEEDILAAFDDAIADGVDIITISIGSHYPNELVNDSIAIGAFHAMEKGILTVQSAGNDGPDTRIVASIAPWIFTVAASTIDRKIIDKVILGSNKTLVGKSINSFSMNKTTYPLITATNASRGCGDGTGSCADGCLREKLVRGKIVICSSPFGNPEALGIGAAGVIALDLNDLEPMVQPLPAVVLDSSNYDLVTSYAASSKNPVGVIVKSETVKDNDAPVVAEFSSRGPNAIIPDILKPDISAPGVNILAAFSFDDPPSLDPSDQRRVKYNFLSGTSMSCPHVAGAAAYVKTIHPNWSPSAIKSALMTTATLMNSTKSVVGEFAYGSGHLNPIKAADPGLIYETEKDDYINLLCSIGLGEDKVKIIAGGNSTCSTTSPKVLPRDLNYPSLAAKAAGDKGFKFEFHRIVKNVGFKSSNYTAKISTDSTLNVGVVPKVLSFSSTQQKQSFIVTVTGKGVPKNKFLSASLVWSDGTHNVRSPIVVYDNI